MESESTPAAATDFSYSSILKRSKQAAVKATLAVPAVEQKSAARTETKTKQSSGGAAKPSGGSSSSSSGSGSGRAAGGAPSGPRPLERKPTAEYVDEELAALKRKLGKK